MVSRNSTKVDHLLVYTVTNVAALTFNLRKIFINWVLFAKYLDSEA